MENNQNSFWKGFLIGAVTFFIIGALGVLGLSRLLQGVADKMSNAATATESVSVPAEETPTATQPQAHSNEATQPPHSGETTAPHSEETAKPAESTETEATAITLIDRTQNAFLDRLGELQQVYEKNQVLPYDSKEMEEAALQAYVEAIGEDWESYKNAVPEYGQNVTVIPRADSAFLNRMAEVAELVDQRKQPSDEEREACELNAMRGFVEGGGDVYSAYLTPAEWDSMQESSSGSYCGIGVQIQQNAKTMESTVVNVFSNSSAKEVGMLPGDIFQAVDDLDVTQMPLDLIVTYVRGEEHTTVKITIYRPLTGETLDFICERRVVEVDTVYYRMLNTAVGYIQLTEFDDVSVTQIKKALNELKSQGMTKLIFDLRSNPGGLLSSVLDISDYFIEKGKLLFKMEYKNGEVYTEKAYDKPLFEGEMIVLIDGGSASASEVMTGIMQDYGRATIMGTKSFGKGIVQSFFSLSDGAMLKVTIAHYFSPLGRDFHGVGITPDIEGEDNVLTEEDELLDQALKQISQ